MNTLMRVVPLLCWVAAVRAVPLASEGGQGVVVLTDQTFEAATADGDEFWLVCGCGWVGGECGGGSGGVGGAAGWVYVVLVLLPLVACRVSRVACRVPGGDVVGVHVLWRVCALRSLVHHH